jgi:hypothetical protein
VNDLHSKFVGMAAQRDEHLDVSVAQVRVHVVPVPPVPSFRGLGSVIAN